MTVACRVARAQIEFFKGVDIEKGASGIVFTCTPEGRPKGEAYVEFPSEEAQKEAVKRHKNEMGERYIELFLSTKANMLQARRCGAVMPVHAGTCPHMAGRRCPLQGRAEPHMPAPCRSAL